MSFVERLLTRVFPREPMPWGTRFRMFGTPNDRMDVSRSLLKRPIPLPGRKSVYLHKMERGDMDRDHHDHPYDFSSLVLAGGYLESSLDPSGVITFRQYNAGSLNRKGATQAHKVNGTRGKEVCWTLFMSGPRRRVWGYYVPGREPGQFTWVHYRAYQEGRE